MPYIEKLKRMENNLYKKNQDGIELEKKRKINMY